MAKIPGVIKGRFYVTTSLSDSWEGFTPSRASWSYPREIFILVSSTFLYSQIYGDHYIWPGRFYTSWRSYPRKIFQYLYREHYMWEDCTLIEVATHVKHSHISAC